MREQESVVEEKAKQKTKQNKDLKNSETWSWEKQVLYSSIMLFIWIHGKKLPKNISICVWKGIDWEGGGWRVPMAA